MEKILIRNLITLACLTVLLSCTTVSEQEETRVVEAVISELRPQPTQVTPVPTIATEQPGSLAPPSTPVTPTSSVPTTTLVAPQKVASPTEAVEEPNPGDEVAVTATSSPLTVMPTQQEITPSSEAAQSLAFLLVAGFLIIVFVAMVITAILYAIQRTR